MEQFGKFAKYLDWIWTEAKDERRRQFIGLMEPQPSAVLLDCGCDDGSFSAEAAGRIRAGLVVGIEKNRIRSIRAKKYGIKIIEGNLNFPFPLSNESIDVCMSDAVIEHIIDLDNFLCEIYRVLRPEGYVVVCTENLAAVHNIYALFCGNQPYSGPTLSRRKKIGHHPVHPALFYPYEGEIDEHTRVMAYKAFKEVFEIHGFRVESVFTAGYFPIPYPFGKWLARLDPWHAAFMGLKARKPAVVFGR